MPLGESFDRILAAARTGADWAWTAIYRDLAPAVLGYLRSSGAAEPEDLMGEVFLQVVRGLHRFTGVERDFRAWVFTVAHHDLVDERRRRKRRSVEAADLPDLIRAGPMGDVEEEAMAGLETERVVRILGRLSPMQQEVLALRIFADLTIEQIARIIGKRPGAVKALQRRGLAAILREISQKGVPL